MSDHPITDPAFLGHLGVFAAAALACFASVARARRIRDPDTRVGLVALLVTSGGWATAHVLFLVVPTPELKVAAYVAGLVIGIGAVGPWLYFCSAYTGRYLHRNRTIRTVAVIAFVAIVAVKVTNPIHGLYFTTEVVSRPFTHLAIRHGLLHWLVMGLAYALAAVGYFMLLELFLQVDADTKPLVALIAVTGLPVVLDVVGLATPYLLEITYEPLGVAAFAVGVSFAYHGRFEAVQLAGGRDEPVIVLSEEGLIRDYNADMHRLFPDRLDRNAIGRPLEDALPAVADVLETDRDVIEVDGDEGTRYYRLTENPFGVGRTRLGTQLTLTDVTHRERYRRELERQNERLEQFADMVSHDLRNPLNVASGRLELAREEHDSEHLESVANAHARMEELIEDVLTLARQGQPIEETETVGLADLAERCWEVVETADADLVVESNLRFEADEDRVQRLLENLFRNAIEHGGSDVTIRVGALDGGGFYVEDDGPGIPAEERDDVFESGYTTAEGGTGFGLAIVDEIASAHGWRIEVTEGDDGGARFEISGVETA